MTFLGGRPTVLMCH